MIEAQELGVDYQTLKNFADELSNKTEIKKVFDISLILKPLGCNIINKSLQDWNLKNFNFVEIYGKNNFSISVCNDLGKEMKRFMLLQGFAHYILHSLRGNKSCYVREMTKGIVGKEGMIFSLCFLLPDELVVKMISDNISNKNMANFFRVPEEMIEMKIEVLTKYKIGAING